MVISCFSTVDISLDPSAAEKIQANPLRTPTFAPMTLPWSLNLGGQGSVVRHHRVRRQQTIRW
jgi:hypothetical protein